MASLLAGALAPLIINSLLKLETGGKVDKTQVAMVHKNEYMLPAGVKPTPAQVKKVNALKKKSVKKSPVKKAPVKKSPVSKKKSDRRKKGKK
jgi:hypothetical protein|tara:strand:+ start:130 stop:405 length:276 start_codon:yes stop_codon:yes gene_type:complete